jgi:hypothetical protein
MNRQWPLGYNRYNTYNTYNNMGLYGAAPIYTAPLPAVGLQGFYPYDNACAYEPCYNGGQCVLDTLRLLWYQCLCPAGTWGEGCEFVAGK